MCDTLQIGMQGPISTFGVWVGPCRYDVVTGAVELIFGATTEHNTKAMEYVDSFERPAECCWCCACVP